MVPGDSKVNESTRADRDKKLAGSRGGRVLERVTPSRIDEPELSPALFPLATPKGDLNQGVRKGQGERFRGDTGGDLKGCKRLIKNGERFFE